MAGAIKTRRLALFGSIGALSIALGNACASGGTGSFSGDDSPSTGGSGNTGNTDGGGVTGGTGGATGGSGGLLTGGQGGDAGGTVTTGGAGGAPAGGAAGRAGAGAGGAAGSPGGAGGQAGDNGEICNALDDDGDGQIDEGNPGGGESCDVSGQNGICRDGETECRDGLIQCTQINLPQAELCDGEDNNCNGAIDEGNPGANQSCDTGLDGICEIGTTACEAGVLVCNQNVMAQPAELCNGLDDDCNGQVDEGNPGGGQFCNTGNQGICAAGTTDCSGGQLDCFQDEMPTGEICDNLDNDCNGTVDDPAAVNGLSCDTGLDGICMAGTTQCAAGVPSCNQTNMPELEACNGLDDDCDGTDDNGDPLTTCARFCGLPGGIPNVAGMACTSGACIITQCPAGRKNDDGDVCNGCEATTCTTQPTGASCGSPNVVSPAASPVTGQIVDVGSSVYLQVQFSPPGPGIPFNPTITLAQGTSEYRMDVVTSCSPDVSINCPQPGGRSGSGTGSNVTSWSMNFNTAPEPCGSGVQAPCTNNSSVPSTLLVKITRENIAGDACNQFTVAISE